MNYQKNIFNIIMQFSTGFSIIIKIYLTPYWKEPHRYPFLIHVDHELAGFALISQRIKTQKNYWNVDDFFVVAKYQRKGVGRFAAENLFKKFPGDWESMQIPENVPAIFFWEKVINKYTSGAFQKSKEIISEPTPHQMLVLRFNSSKKVR